MGFGLAWKYPFTVWALIALALHACIIGFDLQYDDRGVGSVLVLSSPLWGLMYWLPGELLFALNRGHSVQGHRLATVAAGLALCLVADLLVRRFHQNRNQSPRTENRSVRR